MLLMQRILGPAVVGVFALTRTVFTMSRQALAVASFSIGPEITGLVGRKDWKGLKRLYDLSERVVLLLVPTVSVATLLASPWLLAVWLHRRSLYEPGLCFLMALTSAAMGIRDHKYQFQSSSNQHEALSRVLLAAYGGVLVISAVALPFFGVIGFMWAWLAAEIAQTVAILRMNRKLFPTADDCYCRPALEAGGRISGGFWRGGVSGVSCGTAVAGGRRRGGDGLLRSDRAAVLQGLWSFGSSARSFWAVGEPGRWRLLWFSRIAWRVGAVWSDSGAAIWRSPVWD